METAARLVGRGVWGLRRTRAALLLALQDFFRYQGLVQASSLAFFALLSFIPVVFMMLAVAGVIWGSTAEVSRFVEEQAARLSPWTPSDIQAVSARILEKAPGLGWLSLGLIIWTSGLFFATLQATLLLPWTREHAHKTRLWRYAMPWLAGPTLGLALTLVIFANHLAGYLPWHRLPVQISASGWSMLALSLIVFLIYRVLLPFRSRFGVILMTAIGIAIASQVITTLFADFITELPNYSKVYGPLAGIVLFLLWIEYNMALILIGGHLVRVWPDVTPEDQPGG
jgi:membrane protein